MILQASIFSSICCFIVIPLIAVVIILDKQKCTLKIQHVCALFKKVWCQLVFEQHPANLVSIWNLITFSLETITAFVFEYCWLYYVIGDITQSNENVPHCDLCAYLLMLCYTLSWAKVWETPVNCCFSEYISLTHFNHSHFMKWLAMCAEVSWGMSLKLFLKILHTATSATLLWTNKSNTKPCL